MKCLSCGTRAWREPSTGRCLDCLAAEAEGKTNARKWTDPEDAVVEAMHGLHKPTTIQRRIFQKTGVARSVNAVACRAGELGLDYRTNQDGMTVVDAARHLGITRRKIDRLIGNGTIKARGRGKVRIVSLEDLELIRAIYPAESEPTISKTEAMKRLGYCESHITRLLLAGQIRGERIGERWRVSAAHVDQLVAEMKRTGATRRRWDTPPPTPAPQVFDPWLGRDVRAGRHLYAAALRTRTTLVPRRSPRAAHFKKGAYIGQVVARRDADLVVRTLFGDVVVATELIELDKAQRLG